MQKHDMALSGAERQKRRRQKLKLQDTVSVRLTLSGPLHAKLKREAAVKEKTLHEWLKLKLKQ